jgi:hypothetical protein
MDPYTVPGGRFAGRTLASLSPDEQRVLLKTRIPALAEARARLQNRAGARPPPPADDPELCLPLALIQPRPRWPPAPPPEFSNLPKHNPLRDFMKVALSILVVLLIWPHLAAYPGFLIGWGLRALGLRLLEIFSVFCGSLKEQLADLVKDLVVWLESFLWVVPSLDVPGAPVAPGQRLASIALGFVALRAIRVWN